MAVALIVQQLLSVCRLKSLIFGKWLIGPKTVVKKYTSGVGLPRFARNDFSSSRGVHCATW